MRKVNILSPDFDSAWDRDGYNRRSAGLAKQLGAERIGASLYELPDGEKTFPYHFHHGMEEWAIVVEGTPTLRGPDGERELSRGDVVCFPPGPEGAHQLRGPGKVLLVSASRSLEAIEYPDSGKIGVSPPRKIFRLDETADYFEGE